MSRSLPARSGSLNFADNTAHIASYRRRLSQSARNGTCRPASYASWGSGSRAIATRSESSSDFAAA